MPELADKKSTVKSNLSKQDRCSLVERIFDGPDVVCEGEYITLYDFLLDPNICNDPDRIAGVLREFAGWTRYMLQRMQGLNLIEQVEEVCGI